MDQDRRHPPRSSRTLRPEHNKLEYRKLEYRKLKYHTLERNTVDKVQELDKVQEQVLELKELSQGPRPRLAQVPRHLTRPQPETTTEQRIRPRPMVRRPRTLRLPVRTKESTVQPPRSNLPLAWTRKSCRKSFAT